MASKYGNDGLYDIMENIAVATENSRVFYAVEFLQNRYNEADTDARVAAAWNGSGRYIKIPKMMKRISYKVNRETLSKDNTDWTLLFYKYVPDCKESLSSYYEEFPRRFCSREEADGPYGKYWRYTLKL